MPAQSRVLDRHISSQSRPLQRRPSIAERFLPSGPLLQVCPMRDHPRENPVTPWSRGNMLDNGRLYY